MSEIDVDDWQKHTDYRGYNPSDEVVEWFWQIVKAWPAERKSRLLQFTTGTSRIPDKSCSPWLASQTSPSADVSGERRGTVGRVRTRGLRGQGEMGKA
jgi:hypothetical protein